MEETTLNNHEPAFAGPVLVVALSQQSPGADPTVARGLVQSVRAYGNRLTKVVPKDRRGEVLNRTFLNKKYELELYKPTVAALIGIYDIAVFYFADDLDNITRISSHIGAISQEFLFAPLTDQLTPGAWKVLDWLRGESPEGVSAPAFLCVSAIKIGDHLLGLGGRRLREAVAWRIQDLFTKGGCEVAVLNCWSWPELLLIGMSDEITRLVELLDQVEEIMLGDLPDVAGVLGVGSDAIEGGAALTLDILDTWERGRWPERGAEERGGRERDRWSEHDAERVLKSARSRHIIVTVRTQYGLLRSSARCAPEGFARTILQRSISRMSGEEEAQTSQEACTWETIQSALQIEAAPRGPLGGPKAQWSITLLAKPGHQSALIPFVLEIAELWCDAYGEGAGRVRRGVDGHTTTLRLVLHGPPTREVLLLMAAVSLWFRADEAVSRQILDVTSYLTFDTEVESTKSAKEAHDALVRQTTGVDSVRGFDLLRFQPDPGDENGLNDLLTSRFLGITEAMAVREWMGAIRHAISQRDMFGTLLDLEAVRLVVETELLYPSVRDGGEGLEAAVRLWLLDGQTAYHQRIQFSPVLLGGPRLLGELPFGVNQISNMVAGLAHAIFAIADLSFHPSTDQEAGVPEDVRPAVLVVFRPDEGLSVRMAGNVVVLSLSVGHALSPIALCMLFHELGHWVVERWALPGLAPSSVRESAQSWKAALESLTQILLFIPNEEEAEAYRVALVKNFYKDVLAHAAWRELGISRMERWERFREQFLACMALSVRVDNRPSNPQNAHSSWARALVHLRIQQLLETCTVEETFAQVAVEIDEVTDSSWSPVELDGSTRGHLWTLTRESELFWRAEVQQSVWRGNAVLPEEVVTPTSTEALMEHLFQYMAELEFAIRALSDGCKAAEENEYATFAAQYCRETQALIDQLRQLDRQIDQATSDDEETTNYILRAQKKIRRGQIPEDPPWSLLQRDGLPGLRAFAVAREVLAVIPREFCKELSRGARSVAVWRGLRNELLGMGEMNPRATEVAGYKFSNMQRSVEFADYGGSDEHPSIHRIEGVYADPRGRVFSLGSWVRDQAQTRRLASLACLWSVSCRARAGQLRDLLVRGRLVRRWKNTIDRETPRVDVIVEARDESTAFLASGALQDWSIKGLGLRFPAHHAGHFKKGKRLDLQLALHAPTANTSVASYHLMGEVIWHDISPDRNEVEVVRVGVRLSDWNPELYDWMVRAERAITHTREAPRS